ncbi:MAG: hypothetical protein KF718_03505 [Polyangiaceae bacterium]|nr:hypothetical protein [Polyangiaceae bacterium]
MNASATERRPNTSPEPVPGPPLRKESYTTWLYVGLAIIVAVLTVYGMWYAGAPRPGM